MWEGFKKFILRGNVVDLAVGVVVGAAFNTLVQSLVKDIITPLLSVLTGRADFSNYQLTIGKAVVNYGDFINALLSFLIVSVAVYFFVVLPMNKLAAMTSKKKEEAAPIIRNCPYCLSEIPLAASKCKYCGSMVNNKNDDKTS